jgi:hypothetical protein
MGLEAAVLRTEVGMGLARVARRAEEVGTARRLATVVVARRAVALASAGLRRWTARLVGLSVPAPVGLITTTGTRNGLDIRHAGVSVVQYVLTPVALGQIFVTTGGKYCCREACVVCICLRRPLRSVRCYFCSCAPVSIQRASEARHTNASIS